MDEKAVRKNIAEYMQMQYKDVIYRFDLAADQRLSIGQATRNKKLQPLKGYPDMFIAASRNGFNGLFIELKRKDSGVFLKDGSLSTQEHFQQQAEVLERLRGEGYKAEFGVGFDKTKDIIDNYL